MFGNDRQAIVNAGIDHKISSTNSLMARVNLDRFYDTNPQDAVSGNVLQSAGRQFTRHAWTAQLNDTATGSHLWAEHYDRDLTDVFAGQDEITDAIVAAIEPQIYAAENFRAKRKPPNSLDAWDLVMRAL